MDLYEGKQVYVFPRFILQKSFIGLPRRGVAELVHTLRHMGGNQGARGVAVDITKDASDTLFMIYHTLSG